MKQQMPSLDRWLQEAKAEKDAPLCGMYLAHNGTVRQTTRALVRAGAAETEPVRTTAAEADAAFTQEDGIEAEQVIDAADTQQYGSTDVQEDDPAAVQEGQMSDGHAFSKYGRAARAHMYDAVVLHVGSFTDDDLLFVSAQHGIEPDTAVLLKHYVLDQSGTLCDISGLIYFSHFLPLML